MWYNAAGRQDREVNVVGTWVSADSGESETFSSFETNQSKQRVCNVQKRTARSWERYSKDSETNSNLK